MTPPNSPYPYDTVLHPGPHQVEFLRHPGPEGTGPPVWGIRVDGTDLRVLVARATRELWALELDPDDDTAREREEFLLRQHAPLDLDEDRARAHFLGDAEPELRHAPSGAVALLGCTCGIAACWPLLATVTATARTVTWSGFHQPHRPEWGELPLGTLVFDRGGYEAALAAPLPLAEDPLAPFLGTD
ncbi:hypothetical protein [Streptomyces sp. NPDC090022]|uniref:hypothetical protein n=1 Tax=Streptomyces sp. NPDC090022 TaxID=3365920 RepID=UPI00382D3AC0